VRADLPSGTVTLLFTDVEGSTRLLHKLGAEAYAEALAEHRRVIREACAAEHGVEVDTQGDAIFVAFPAAPGALAAAGAMTEALAAGPIRVRIGLHTGTPLLADEGYVGGDVHRAARIAAAGHGGQVLVSATTAALVDVELTDLGEHRFKDLGAPERVYQLGTGDFPVLKSLYRTNLPVPATPFLGRERELSEVVALIARDDIRLLTLTGPGGTGKTRLALQAAAEAADEYPDGVFWVPLAPLRDAGHVFDQAAQALGSSEPLKTLVGDRRMLLVFDNFEHVMTAASGLAGVLGVCPNLDVVVTSRELLQLHGEHAYLVPSLDERDGVALFLARARAVSPELEADGAVGELCEKLDNLPLALELAASRTRHLTPQQLLARLGERLDLLVGPRDADPRQQTLRATIAWSHDLLEPSERKAFARLSVFAGDWTTEAAEAIAEASFETLASLVDKSLVRWTGERYWMFETIREFAAGELDEAGETERLCRRHAEHYFDLARTLGFTLESVEAGATQRHDVAIAEHDNFRAAVDWAIDADPLLGLRLATSLEMFWNSYSPFEASRMFEGLVERVEEMPADLEALATRCLGNFAVLTGDHERGLELYEDSLGQYERLGDEHAQAILEHRLAGGLIAHGQPERGLALEARSLARSRAGGFRINEAMVGATLGEREIEEGNTARGLEMMTDALELAHEAGFKWMEANLLNALAGHALALGRLDDVERYARSAVVVGHEMGDRRHAVQALVLLAAVAAGRGGSRRAGLLWGAVEAEELRGPLGRRPRMAAWEQDREKFHALVHAEPDAAFDRGLIEGRRLSLDDAIAYAVGDAI
jgi:predicted ATPase/class 3 adenylate cyclase